MFEQETAGVGEPRCRFKTAAAATLTDATYPEPNHSEDASGEALRYAWGIKKKKQERKIVQDYPSHYFRFDDDDHNFEQ